MAMRHARDGFSLPEVLVAAILIGLIALGVGRVLGQSTVTAREERHRLQAILIAHSEMARLSVVGHDLLSQADTFTVNGFGERVPDGDYRVEIATDVRCEGGPEPYDNQFMPNPFGDDCGAERAIGVARVTVRYPADGTPSGRSVTYEIALGHSAAFADSAGFE